MARILAEVIAQYRSSGLTQEAEELEGWLAQNPQIPQELRAKTPVAAKQTAASQESTDGQEETPEAALLRVRFEYNTKPHAPEFIQESWQTMYGAWIAIAKREDPSFDMIVPVVPDCGRTQKQLEDLEADEKGRVYVVPMAYEMFAKLFPRMRSDDVARGRIHDDVAVEGWYDFDIRIDAPHLGITESGLRAMAVDGWEVAAAKTYIAASYASKVFVDRYLDQGNARGENLTFSLLPNSRLSGRAVKASFGPHWNPYHSRGGRLQRK